MVTRKHRLRLKLPDGEAAAKLACSLTIEHLPFAY